MGKTVLVECEVEWAKLRPEDRDMGPNDGSDMANTFAMKQGVYVVNLMLDEKTKSKMISDGVPNSGLQAQLFKTNKEGRMYYKSTRPHFNPKFTDQETGEQGVVVGPPAMFKKVDNDYVAWDWETDGLIGNGTKALVKLDVWEGKITTLEKLAVVDHVPYESKVEDRSVF